jgi:cysteine desulfurase
MTRPIYLDYNGTTPHDPAVIEAMRPFFETEFGNPSSSHWYGIAPKRWAKGTLRFTTGRMTTADEIDRALEVIVSAVQKQRR